MSGEANLAHDDLQTASKLIRREIVIAAGAFVLALLVLGQGISAPFQKDAEPQSAEWIRSVANDGNWLLPLDSGGGLARKPPLFYWLAAVVTNATGGNVDEVRARVVSLAAGAALAVAVLLWTRASIGAGVGWLAFFFLLGSYGYASRANLALTDMLMTLEVFIAYCLMQPLIEGAESRSRAAAVGALLGAGILTKGPIVIVLAGLGAALYLLTLRENPLRCLARPWPWTVVAVAIAIGALWYVPASLVGGELFWKMMFDENLGHFLPVRLGGTGEAERPLYHILYRLLQGALPLSLLVPASAVAFWQGALEPRLRRPVLYQAAFVIAALVFFSLASAKRDDYILPELPGLAILLASLFIAAERKALATRIRDLTVVVLGAAAIGFVVGAPILFRSVDLAALASERLHSSDALIVAIFQRQVVEFDPRLAVLGTIALAAGCVALAAVWRGVPIAAAGAVTAIGLAACLLWTTAIRPELARLRGLKAFVLEVRERVGTAPLYVVRGPNYELSFYYGAPVPALVRRRRELVWPSGHAYLFATAREVAMLPDAYRRRLRLVAQFDPAATHHPPALYDLLPATEGAELKPSGEAAK
jgi:4-amino-4-deoxy-L-arabinose transferase-like glycosyltransferase